MAKFRDLSAMALADMAVLEAVIPSNWTEGWGNFARVFYVGLLASKEITAPPDALARVAIEQVRVMGQQLGGQQHYIPRGTVMNQGADIDRIRREFNGKNYDDLAARYDLSESRIRQILNSKKGTS